MKHLDAITEILAPQLAGESVSQGTEVLLEQSVGRLSAAVARGAAVGSAPDSSEDLGGAFNPGGFLAVTPTRVFALSQTSVKAQPKELVFALDRSGLRCERGSKRLMGVIKLDTITLVSGDFSVTFHIPKNAKVDGQATMSELGA